MRFFTSDLHFYHKNVIEFCKRPWLDNLAMNQGLIENWNRTVGVDDEIFILGDMFFCGTNRAKEIMQRLNGKKFLILGNHDWNVVKKPRAKEFGFEWVLEQFCVRIAGKDVIMNHFPYSGDHMEEDRFLDKRPIDAGMWLLHGHVHSEWKVRGRQINVGVDVWDWRPVPEIEIENIITGGDK